MRVILDKKANKVVIDSGTFTETYFFKTRKEAFMFYDELKDELIRKKKKTVLNEDRGFFENVCYFLNC